jgi:3-hydroxyisobutyrate dehydrogenase-like beta-hydroxyacid dehydrogenase
MDVGFIGLGLMGRAMAGNLIKAGHRVTVHNRTRSRSEELSAAGAEIAETAGGACRGPVVITCLADDQAVEAMVFGDDGVAAELAPGSIHVSMSTISIELTDRLNATHSQRGQRFIAAPVFGRPDAAAAGQLLIVAGGEEGAIQLCRGLFDAMGRSIVIGTEPRAAAMLKLVGNFLLVSTVETLAEVVTLLRKSGIDPHVCLNALTDTLFASPVHKTYASRMLGEQYEPGFRMSLGQKDIGLALAAANRVGVPLPTGEFLQKRLEIGASRGLDNKDLAALALICSQDAGLGGDSGNN